MTWLNRHLNITWGIVVLLMIPTILLESPIPYLVARIIFVLATLWVIRQKGRSWLWVLIPPSVLFLNHKEASALDDEKVDDEVRQFQYMNCDGCGFCGEGGCNTEANIDNGYCYTFQPKAGTV